MQKAWEDLKSFVTVALTLALIGLIIFSLITGKTLEEKLLLLFSNLTTSVFTYYFTKKNNDKEEIVENAEKQQGVITIPCF